MRIKEMTATFGRLNQAKLRPGPGLTVITAPNEGGKSTWAAFLRAMLYGVSTNERDKAGRLAEKNKYAPWSGAPMEGEMVLIWQGKDIILRRFANKAGPLGGFEAVYAASGDPVPELTAETAGPLLIGAGREMYERSGFLGQGSAAVTASEELEQRIAALVTTGEEISPTQVKRQLKDWANRRRSNRANGLIPELEEELAKVEGKLEELASVRRAEAEAAEECARLESTRTRLGRELELHRDLERRELDRQYMQALKDLEQARAQVPPPGDDPIFGHMTAQEAWNQAEDDADLLDELARPAPLTGLVPVCVALVLLAAVLLGVGGALTKPLLMAASIIPLLALGGFLVWKLNAHRKLTARREVQAIRILQEYDAEEADELLDRAAEYREKIASTQQAIAAADAAQALVDTLAAQGAKEYSGPDVLTRPARPREETVTQLECANADLDRARDRLARARGMLSAIGDPDSLEARREALLEEQAARTQELEAINEAIEAMDRAEEELRRRFSPALNRRTGELLDHLTGGAHRSASLTRTFEASVGTEGELLPRSGLFLSGGTLDQLYLAVRLAVCELTLSQPEPAPLVLDDALANFDGARMTAALELLARLGKERQILLFTCHQREADWANRHGVPHISLTN